MPRYGSIPLPLGRPRVTPVRGYARFYALYEDQTGATHRVSFQVRVDRYSPRMKYHWVATIVHMLKQRQVPVCYSGQVFDGFPELVRTRWVRIRKLKRYKAGVVYER